MVVQHILAVRRAKREVRVPVDSPVMKTENSSEEPKPETQDDQMEVDEIKKVEPVEGTEQTEPETAVAVKEESDIMKVDSTSEKGVDECKPGEYKTELVDVEEFYVKYRNFSYLHCEWKTEEELRRGDRRIFSKIKRFQQKMANNVNIFEYVCFIMGAYYMLSSVNAVVIKFCLIFSWRMNRSIRTSSKSTVCLTWQNTLIQLPTSLSSIIW